MGIDWELRTLGKAQDYNDGVGQSSLVLLNGVAVPGNETTTDKKPLAPMPPAAQAQPAPGLWGRLWGGGGAEAPMSTGDSFASQQAARLRGMQSESPITDGMQGAVTGRVSAVQRLANDGLPAPTRVLDGVQRAFGLGSFFAGGGADRVTAGDVAQVGVAAGRDAVANSNVLEAMQRAPQAARTAAQGTQVAATMTGAGRDELRAAGGDLARNKATEVGASMATGSAMAMGMRGAGAMVPPLPHLLPIKAGLIGGSYLVQGAGMLNAAYGAADFADRVDGARDKSHMAGSAIDDVMSRRANK